MTAACVRKMSMLLGDLHIHTALSPCAEADMTPGNIVGMAKLKGLDVIAITDHQSLGNAAAVIAMSRQLQGPIVLPGLEVSSAEEIHLICLFSDLERAARLEKIVQDNLMRRLNRPDIFGTQLLLSPDDAVLGHFPDLLLMPTRLSAQQIAAKTLAFGGACLPAHVDRDANSMLTTFGLIPDDFPAAYLEISRALTPDAFKRQHPELKNHPILQSSDAHRLGDIAEPGHPLPLLEGRDELGVAQRLILALRPDGKQ